MTIAIALMLSATAGKAQDTVPGLYTGDNYFYNYMVDTSYEFWSGLLPGASWEKGGVLAKRLDCGRDTLKVVGVAAAMSTELDEQGYPTDSTIAQEYAWYVQYHLYTMDTSLESCYEYFLIYKREGDPVQGTDTMRALDSVMVHRTHDTVKYILDAYHGSYYYSYHNEYYRLYEKRFANPITVTDSFYLGLTQHTRDKWLDFDNNLAWWYRIGFGVLGYYYVGDKPNREMGEFWAEFNGTRWWFRNQLRNPKNHYHYMFPILEADTARPVSVETVERFTMLFPNPASARATVSSSFGLECVRVYNAAGVEVLRMDGLTGTSAALEVGSLPRGTYLVHIHTPAGTAVKRLAVP